MKKRKKKPKAEDMWILDGNAYQAFFGIFLIIVFAIASYKGKKLDMAGAVSGFFIALCIFLGAGFPFLLLLFAFFVMGIAASKWKQAEKEKALLSQSQEGIRSWGNAFGNGGIAGICGFLLLLYPAEAGLELCLAGSLAGATADTLSSELGNVYGSRYMDILTFRKGQRGKDGVVSLEGLLAGAAGALLIALISPLPWFSVFLGGIAGTLVDSLLGATLERKGILGNHSVNFASTLAAGCLSGFLGTCIWQ